MDLAGFRARYGEFRNTPDVLVQLVLDSAALEMTAAVWGTYYDQGQGLLAAHSLTLAPEGVLARLAADPKASTYGQQFADLRLEVTAAMRVF